jgi:hypothetical protein
MEPKPKSIKLVGFKEELLPSGRKLIHCILEDKYGDSRFRYRWTAPWRDKEGEHGVERLFLKCLEIEEWNDYEGVWSEELRKVSKEVPSLEEAKLPVKISFGGITDDVKVNEVGEAVEYWVLQVSILQDELPVMLHKQAGKDYILIGEVSMSWDSLQKELFNTEGVKFLSAQDCKLLGPELSPIIGVDFRIGVEKLADKTQYQIISRRIASCIRHFIRSRLSEYKAIKKGFAEE